MAEQDKRTRQLWLYSYILSLVAGQLLTYLSPPPGMPRPIHLISTLIGILGFWLVYRCAYQKPGTKLLTFFIWTTPISFGVCLLFYSFAPVAFRTQDLISMPFSLVWYAFCFPMRKLNRRLQNSV